MLYLVVAVYVYRVNHWLLSRLATARPLDRNSSPERQRPLRTLKTTQNCRSVFVETICLFLVKRIWFLLALQNCTHGHCSFIRAFFNGGKILLDIESSAIKNFWLTPLQYTLLYLWYGLLISQVGVVQSEFKLWFRRNDVAWTVLVEQSGT